MPNSYFCYIFVNQGLCYKSGPQKLHLPLCRLVIFSQGQRRVFAWIWVCLVWGFLVGGWFGFFPLSISVIGCGVSMPDYTPRKNLSC